MYCFFHRFSNLENSLHKQLINVNKILSNYYWNMFRMQSIFRLEFDETFFFRRWLKIDELEFSSVPSSNPATTGNKIQLHYQWVLFFVLFLKAKQFIFSERLRFHFEIVLLLLILYFHENLWLQPNDNQHFS